MATLRYYDPVSARFLSEDRVLTDQNTGSSFNRYVYANNPYKYIDPDGRSDFCSGLSRMNCCTLIDSTYGSSTTSPERRTDANFSAADLPSIPQPVVDAVAGFGDGVSSTLTFGIYSTADFRKSQGIGGVAYSSNSYFGGQVAGHTWGTATIWAGGLNGGSSSVFWSGPGNLGRAAKLGTSLESTPIGAALNFAGAGVPYIVWKAASATFAANAKGAATKVGSQSGNIWRTIELKILQLRGIPVKFVP